jgi:hypothetical protein
LSQQNLDTNLTENEVTPKISLGYTSIPLRRRTAKYWRSQYASRFVTTSRLPSRTKQRNEREIDRGICNGVNSNDAHCPIPMQFMALEIPNLNPFYCYISRLYATLARPIMSLPDLATEFKTIKRRILFGS